MRQARYFAPRTIGTTLGIRERNHLKVPFILIVCIWKPYGEVISWLM